jgi:hypothetical protein
VRPPHPPRDHRERDEVQRVEQNLPPRVAEVVRQHQPQRPVQRGDAEEVLRVVDVPLRREVERCGHERPAVVWVAQGQPGVFEDVVIEQSVAALRLDGGEFRVERRPEREVGAQKQRGGVEQRESGSAHREVLRRAHSVGHSAANGYRGESKVVRSKVAKSSTGRSADFDLTTFDLTTFDG